MDCPVNADSRRGEASNCWQMASDVACAVCGAYSDRFGVPLRLEDSPDYELCPSCGMPSGPHSRPRPPVSHATVASVKLFALLATALNEVVPEGVTLEPTAEGVQINLAGGGARIVEVWEDSVSVEEFAVELMRALQDEVIEEVTKTGWPPRDPAQPDAPQFGNDLPGPHAEVGARSLRCWYGERERPSLCVATFSLPSG
jgi:hypothetical protein